MQVKAEANLRREAAPKPKCRCPSRCLVGAEAYACGSEWRPWTKARGKAKMKKRRGKKSLTQADVVVVVDCSGNCPGPSIGPLAMRVGFTFMRVQRSGHVQLRGGKAVALLAAGIPHPKLRIQNEQVEKITANSS